MSRPTSEPADLERERRQKENEIFGLETDLKHEKADHEELESDIERREKEIKKLEVELVKLKYEDKKIETKVQAEENILKDKRKKMQTSRLH